MIKLPALLAPLALVSLATSAHAQTGVPEDWYPFTPANDYSQTSLIGLDAWVEPAGAHGRIERQGEKLFYNGREFKMWGTNTGYGDSSPSKEDAERAAAMFRKFGYNALRHHKHIDGPNWQGFQSQDSFVEFDPEKLDRFDYFNKQLKDAGVFLLHSPTFGVRFGPGDVDRIPYHEEIGTEYRNKRIRAPHGMVYLAKELQDLQIEQTVKFLNHTNPYTGMRYADDPQLFCVELFNEDSVLFFGTNSALQKTPTIRARVARQFSEWLSAKYGSEQAWRKAWGEPAIITDPSQIGNPHLRGLVGVDNVRGELAPEKLAAGTVVPWSTPWFNDAAQTPGSAQAFLQQRMLDTAIFLVELQDQFYHRFAVEIRKTGFKGDIVASNWQAGSLVGHLLNLYSDAKTGIVDRHNYFGGGRGALKNNREFKHGSLLSSPGKGSLSAGFQQVDDCAFMISEWTHVQPNEYYAEGPVIMGAYGWGLQGWDVSYNFALHGDPYGAMSNHIGEGAWDIMNPMITATMPAVSRMVRRMDVTESPKTHTLNAHIPSVKEGKMSFRGTTIQNHDEKTFSTGKVPPEALAAIRVAVAFTDKYEETKTFNAEPYRKDGAIVSITEQLRWIPGDPEEPASGIVTIDTDGAKGFVGFAPGGKTFDLGDGFAITPEKGFAVVLLTAKGENETLANTREIVMVAMARGRNTGMEFNEEGNRVLKAGSAPIRMEPVKAEIATPFGGTLHVLDQDGIAAREKRSFKGGLAINGAQDKTPFYLITK